MYLWSRNIDNESQKEEERESPKKTMSIQESVGLLDRTLDVGGSQDFHNVTPDL